MDLLVERCAGLDVAKQEVVACVRTPAPGAAGQRRQQIRTFATFSADLQALADWLEAEGVTQMVMEATGQQLEADLVRAGGARAGAAAGRAPATSRSCPGRKTDVADAAWLAELLEHGLLRSSFVPPPPVRHCGTCAATTRS